MIEKLELKHLSPYLPYELKMKVAANPTPTHTLCGLVCNNSCFVSELGMKQWIRIYKPILHPLSDLTSNQKIDLFELLQGSNLLRQHKINLLTRTDLDLKYIIDKTDYCIMEKLFEWHFDVYGLIESGLAIDINTL